VLSNNHVMFFQNEKKKRKTEYIFAFKICLGPYVS